MENGTPKPEDAKLCPYLPPMPELQPEMTQKGLITGRQMPTGRLLFAPCQKEMCAIFHNCQGQYSPRALAVAIDDLRETLANKLPGFAPLLTRFFPAK